MMSDRFGSTFIFDNPLPEGRRSTDWAHCGRCCAALYSQFAGHPLVQLQTPVKPVKRGTDREQSTQPTQMPRVDFVSQLSLLCNMRLQGALSEAEFLAAKARLLA